MKGKKYRSKESTALEALRMRILHNPQPGDALIGIRSPGPGMDKWLKRHFLKLYGAKHAEYMARGYRREYDVYVLGVGTPPNGDDPAIYWSFFAGENLSRHYENKDNHEYRMIETLNYTYALPEEEPLVHQSNPFQIERIADERTNYIHRGEGIVIFEPRTRQNRRKQDKYNPHDNWKAKSLDAWWQDVRDARIVIPYDAQQAGKDTMVKILNRQFQVVEADLLDSKAWDEFCDLKDADPDREEVGKTETGQALLVTSFNSSAYLPNFTTMLFDKGSGQLPTIIARSETYEEAKQAHQEHLNRVLQEEIALEADLEYEV